MEDRQRMLVGPLPVCKSVFGFDTFWTVGVFSSVRFAAPDIFLFRVHGISGLLQRPGFDRRKVLFGASAWVTFVDFVSQFCAPLPAFFGCLFPNASYRASRMAVTKYSS